MRRQHTHVPFHSLNLSVATANTGTVSGAGLYHKRHTVSVSATPASHYHFVSWSDGGAATHDVTMGGSDISLTATFAIDRYNVYVSSNDINMGTVSGGNTYDYWSDVSLSATAKPKYHFVNWTEGSTVVSTSSTFTFTLEASDRTFVGNFAANTYNIEVAVASGQSGWGTVSGGGTVVDSGTSGGTTRTITATANNGYSFVEWNDGNTSASRTVSATELADGATVTYTATFVQRYTIILSSNDSSHCTLNGGGTYNNGSIVTISCNPETGYHFNYWTDPDGTITYTNSRLITVTGTATYTANISIDTHTVNAEISPANTGSVSGTGTYNYGSTASLTATGATGYHFVKWGDDTTTNPKTFIVTEDVGVIAHFGLNTYTINVSVASGCIGMGTVSGSNTYTHGQSVTITATPSTNYHFVKWSDDNTESSRTFTATSDVNLTATFAIDQYTLTVNTNNSNYGTVTPSGTHTYDYGAVVSVSASETDHHHFVRWSDGGAQTHNVTVDSNKTVEATFAVDTHVITVDVDSSSTGCGTVYGGGTCDYGKLITFGATANTGYSFLKWKDGNTDNPRTETVTGDQRYSAQFSINNYVLTLTPSDTTMGSVSGGGLKMYSSSVTATATANSKYHFKDWSDTDTGTQQSTNASYNFTMPANNVKLTANFLANTYIIAVAVASGQSTWGSVSGGGTVTDSETSVGSTITITATANSGYKFLHWNDGDTNTSRTVGATGLAQGSTVTYTATFVKSWTLTLSAGTGGSVYPSGTNTYNDGATVTISATQSSGYRFLSWSDGGAQSHDVTMDSNKSISASFQKTYEITVSGGPGCGTISGDGTYDSGATCTLTAASSDNNHYHFNGWYKGETLMSSNSTYTFTVTANGDYKALFTHGYSVTVHQQTGGTITGADWYAEGSTCTLDVIPASHYRFAKLDGPQEVFSLPYTFTVTNDSDWTPSYQHQYYITVTSEDRTAGSTTGGNNWYDDGTKVQFSADSYAGYRFSHWSDGSTEQGRTTTADADKTFTASFLRVYTVSASAGTGGQVKFNEGSASSSISHDYDTGSTVTIVAVPNSGYAFYQWSDGTTNATKTITNLSADVSLRATFASGYTITGVSSNATYGSVTGGGTYLPNTQVTLTANAVTNTGAFVGWSDDDLSNPRTVTATGNATYTANFEAAGGPYNVYVQNDQPYGYTVLDSNVSTDVSTNISSNRYVGTLYTAGVNPLNGYVLDKIRTFSDTGTYITARNTSFDLHRPIGIGMLILADVYTLNYLCDSTERTSSSITIDGYTYNGYGWVTARNFDAVNAQFYGVVSDNFAYRIYHTETTTTLPGTVSVHAKDYRMHNVSNVYHQMQYKLADGFYSVMARTNSYNGTVSGSGAYSEGSYVIVKADADTASGYTFVGWLDESGNVESYDARYTFRIQGNRVLTASFVKAKAKVSASASPSGSGTFTGTGTYDVGTTVTLTAVPATGYQFSNWSDKVTTASRKVELTTTGEYTFTANFTKLTYSMKAISNDSTMGKATVSPISVEYGGSATFTATAYEGYEFTGWDDGTTDESYTVRNITSNITLTANFQAKEKEKAQVSVGYVGNEGEALINGYDFHKFVESPLDVTIGDTVQLKAGEGFLGWYLNDKKTLLSKDKDFSYTVTGDCTILASFK